ncbi:hypothetical protein SAMN05892883_1883 [Jatrophihabitans sp. GAS493]|uniref:hemerythrin domain-containing protein n=1 Tax=Jatrophihabitans sp. GAS493 TaxID=1907575 RepID=UPI000BB6AA8D|nr:hemerythrin domain-containing protein [Jatrophihabitans sp. GAS493]SOD72492.1 hypothetical protein SAMN05892883_1883 [Jatrophihabitans sp. GAS493]
MTHSDGQTILDVLAGDSRSITALASKLAATTDPFDENVETVQLVREIVQTHVAAEQYLHPLIRKALPDGESLAHQQFAEHRSMEEVLRNLEDVDPNTDRFKTLLAEVRDKWSANADYLEREIFPVLHEKADWAELIELADSAVGAENLGPTRPRSVAVEQHATSVLLSLSQGYIDRTIDAYTHRGHAGTDEIEARLRAGRYDDTEPAGTEG